MPMPKPAVTESEVGKYVCPKTKLLAPLRATGSFASIEWPFEVEHCAECGEKHVLSCEEVLHVPVFGYE